MELFFVIPFLMIVAWIGYEDVKTRLIRDIALASLWFLLAVSFAPIGRPLIIAAQGFAFSYFLLYALMIQLSGKPLFKFGDVLLFPVCLAFCFHVGGYAGMGVAVLALGFSFIYSYKKSLPFGAVMFVVCAISAFLGGLGLLV